MDAVRFGLSIRALRRRRGWTQVELGRRSGVSGSSISRAERGGADRFTVRSLERVLGAMGARILVRALWQGEELDRLLDADHAHIVEWVVRRLAAHGWIALPEATFHVRAERGSIDVLAFHPTTSALLVVEVKSTMPDVQATLSGVDRKTRLGPVLARDRGWSVTSVSRLLVLPSDRTSRRRVARFGSTFDRALPARTVEIRRWLRSPGGPMAGVLFVSDLPHVQARHRVRGAVRGPVHEDATSR